MDGTILGQGVFTASSTGLANPNPGNATQANAVSTIIQIPSGADWLCVRNYQAMSRAGLAGGAYFNGVANAYIGQKFFWQRGMPAGSAIVESYLISAAGVATDVITTGGFTLYDPSNFAQNPVLSAPVATTAVTNAVRPVVSTANTAGLSVGSVVRLSNNAQVDNNGPEFVVGAVVANTSFTLLTATNPLANVPGAVGGATGFYRIVNRDELFYPRKRFIVNITQAVNPQVSTSVPHGMTAGQAIRFQIPAVSGMVQLNSTAQNNYRYASILSVLDDYNFLIDIDTTAYTAFSWPTVAQQPSGYPIMVPVGENTAVALSSPANLQVQTPQVAGLQIHNTQTGILADATVNTGFLGMILGIGGAGQNPTIGGAPIIGPAGAISWSAGNVATGDTMYWVAGKSSYGGL